MYLHVTPQRAVWTAAVVLLLAMAFAGCDGAGSTSAAVNPTQTSSAVLTGPIPPGDICPNGGVQVDTGIDENGNGLLDPEEVDNTVYVCDGIPGLVTAIEEPPGLNCSNGGTRIDSGLDRNGNGLLDTDEITTTSYACNADIIPPVVPTLDPYPEITNLTTLTLSGTKEIASAIWINGKQVTKLDGLEVWKAQVTMLKDTKYIFTITATDEPGNVSGAVQAVIVRDTVPPKPPTVDSVPKIVTSRVLPLTGTKPAESGIAYSVNGRRPLEIVAPDKEMLWKAELKLDEGVNKLEVMATDLAGNLSSALGYEVFVDSTPPAELTVSEPRSPTTIARQVLSGTKEGGKTGTSSVWINGKEVWPLDSSTEWSAKILLVEGANEFLVTSKDEYGNETAGVTRTVILDTIGEDVVNLTATPNTVGPTVTFRWKDPPDERVESVDIRVDSVSFPATINDGTSVLAAPVGPGIGKATDINDATTPLVAGNKYLYTVFVTDTLGHVSPGVNVAVYIAGAGSLDETFGGTGFVTDTGGSAVGARANALMAEPSGRGVWLTGASANGTNDDMSLWLVGEEGNILFQKEFGDVACCPSGGSAGHDAGNAIANYSADLFVVAGSSFNGKDLDMVLWRFTSKGLLDTDFGRSGGYVIFKWPKEALSTYTDDVGYGVVVDRRSRTIVTGSSKATGQKDMLVWVFDALGNPDTSFGPNLYPVDKYPDGFRITRMKGDSEGRAVAVDAKGRIVVAGYVTGRDGTTHDMALWRFLPDGSALDPDFNTTGFVSHDSAAGGSDDDEALALTIDPITGNIFVAGSSRNAKGNLDAVVWSYNEKGALTIGKGAFGGAKGFVVLDRTNDDVATGIALDPDGRVLVSGRSSNGTDDDLVAWRLTATGALDTTFNSTGLFKFDKTVQENGTGILVDLKKRIVIGGAMGDALTTPDATGQSMTVLRLIP